MKNKYWIGFVMIGLIVAFFSGCAVSSPYELQILLNKQPYKLLSMKEIKTMPAESFVMDGKIESGPTVATLLQYAGIQTYAKIEVMNEAYELVEFTSEQDLKQLILDISNRHNVKLASRSIPKKDWMKDITTIAVSTHP